MKVFLNYYFCKEMPIYSIYYWLRWKIKLQTLESHSKHESCLTFTWIGVTFNIGMFYVLVANENLP